MPAFTFEKISPPKRVEAARPLVPATNRGAIVRFLDRLTMARLKKSEDSFRKVQSLKQKHRRDV